MLMKTDPAHLQSDTRAARDYIATMAGELAGMARDTGDRRLALVLDMAASFAELGPRRDG